MFIFPASFSRLFFFSPFLTPSAQNEAGGTARHIYASAYHCEKLRQYCLSNLSDFWEASSISFGKQLILMQGSFVQCNLILQFCKTVRKNWGNQKQWVQTKAEDRNLKTLRYSLQLGYNKENANHWLNRQTSASCPRHKHTCTFANTHYMHLFKRIHWRSDHHFHRDATRAAPTKPVIRILHFVGNHSVREGRAERTSASHIIDSFSFRQNNYLLQHSWKVSICPVLKNSHQGNHKTSSAVYLTTQLSLVLQGLSSPNIKPQSPAV